MGVVTLGGGMAWNLDQKTCRFVHHFTCYHHFNRIAPLSSLALPINTGRGTRRAMQTASHGARAIRGHVPQLNAVLGTKTGASRSIHTSSALRFSPLPHATHHTPASFTQRLFSQTKTTVGRYFALLTAPGRVGATSTPASFSNVAHLARSNVPPIQQTFSMQANRAVGRPFGAYHLPKAPGFAPRSVSQVGLGTARSFHSSRLLFQNLVENAPIALRTFTEADWELETKGKQQAKMVKRKETHEMKKTKEMAKPVEKKPQPVSETQAEFDHYFAAPPATVITNLFVPLAPTPSSRQPLPSTPSPSLIPLSILLEVHASHELHSLRVSSLFSRLDAAKVWIDPGISCSVYGDPSGLASIMKIEFKGWTKAQVRAVLGEGGRGWCLMEELGAEDLPDSLPLSPALSGISTLPSGYSTPPYSFDEGDSLAGDPSPSEFDVDPSDSLVIPSLELSNHEAWADSPRMPEHITIPGSSSDWELDVDNGPEGISERDQFIDHSDSTGFGWMVMSSRVSVVDDESREYTF